MAAGQSSSSTTVGASRWGRASIICALNALGPLLGCSSGGELPERLPDEGPPAPSNPNELSLPFLVEDYFVPNGCFGDANCTGSVIAIDDRACTDRVASTQSVCRGYTYAPLAEDAPGYQGFLGILFQDAAPQGSHDIGRVPGLPVAPGAARLVFWAAVGAGEVDVSFRAGGANNWEGATDPSLPYKDDFGVEKEVLLTSEFQQVEIDLSQVSYETVVSPFGWAIESRGGSEPIQLFIDDLRWE